MGAHRLLKATQRPMWGAALGRDRVPQPVPKAQGGSKSGSNFWVTVH